MTGNSWCSGRKVAAASMVSVSVAESNFQPSSPLGYRLQKYREAVLSCAQEHGVKNVRVFGSVRRGTDSTTSDVDLLVDLPPEMGLFSLARFERELAELLGIAVDVVPAASLKPHLAAKVLSDAVPL